MDNKRINKYRSGAIGALLDIYEDVVEQLKNLIDGISDDAFKQIVDNETKDSDCRSIQTIISHVVTAGYGYANYIREAFQLPSTALTSRVDTRHQSLILLDWMVNYTSQALAEKWELTDEEISKINIYTRWGEIYNLEQLLEHAIVHILRHKRQIERFLLYDGENLTAL